MTTFVDGDILYAGSLETILTRLAALEAKDLAQDAEDVPAWWRGKMAATLSATSGNYRSLPVTTKHAGEGLAGLTTSGDCIIPPAGVYDVSAVCTWPNSGTGYRGLGIVINPGATTRDATTAPTGTVLEYLETPATSGSNFCMTLPKRRVRLNGTDKVMVYTFHNVGSAVTIPNAVNLVDIELTRVGA